VYGIKPGGRTLQQCLDRFFVARDPREGKRNAIEGDAEIPGVECKAALKKNSANVCMNDSTMNVSAAKALLAWVPETEEICWAASMDDVRRDECRKWLDLQETWLILRDQIPVL
jgi:hypothetical protein